MSVNLLDCGVNIQDLAHLLAAAVVKDANGVKYLRVDLTVHASDAIDPAAECGVYQDPQEVLRELFEVEGDNLILNLSIPHVPA